MKVKSGVRTNSTSTCLQAFCTDIHVGSLFILVVFNVLVGVLIDDGISMMNHELNFVFV